MKLYFIAFDVLIPIILIGNGVILRNHPPQKINTYYGYHSKRSMRNKETWIFAQRTFGIFSIWLGMFVLIILAILLLAYTNKTTQAMETMSYCYFGTTLLARFLLYFPVEAALKRNFKC